MASSPLLLALLLLLLLPLLSDASIPDPSDVASGPDLAALNEVEDLKAKISALESKIADSTRELESKDGSLAQYEKIMQEKSEKITLLQTKIESIQKKGAVNSKELLEKAHSRSSALEKQIETLNVQIQTQTQKKDALESRINEANKKIEELASKMDFLQKTNDEQKRRIQINERLLKVAEEELMKAKLEVSSKLKELAEVHNAWLPTWLATHLEYCQKYTATQWNHHGKPAFETLLLKASDLSAKAKKHVKPHLETVHDKWVPALKEHWVAFLTFIDPHVQRASVKTSEFYKTSLSAIKPHALRAHELANPYFQEAKKISKPYIDQVATVTRPHVEKVRIVLKPYTKKAIHAYGKFLKSATSYHQQVQAVAHKKLKKYELTKALATKELVWFLASAFLAVPIYLLFLFVASFFSKRPRKHSQHSHANHVHRRPKRRHAEK